VTDHGRKASAGSAPACQGGPAAPKAPVFSAAWVLDVLEQRGDLRDRELAHLGEAHAKPHQVEPEPGPVEGAFPDLAGAGGIGGGIGRQADQQEHGQRRQQEGLPAVQLACLSAHQFPFSFLLIIVTPGYFLCQLFLQLS